MSTIQFPGLSTGIDTQALIAQMMMLERRTINVYEQRRQKYETKKDALSEIESKLTSLKNTVDDLSNSDKLRAYNVTSTDSDIITASATYNAFEGSHNVVVNQLASAERWVHTAGFEYAEDYVGAGTFIYSYNHKEATIETTDSTTLQDLAGLINNDADNPGITASLLYYDDAYHMVLSGNDAGTDYEVSVNASNTEVWQMDSAFEVDGNSATLSTLITDLDQFGGALGTDDKITITGTDSTGAAITPIELTVTDQTRIEHLIGEINDAFDGTARAVFENGKIVLTDDVSGASSTSISLNFTQGTGSTATLTLPSDAADWDVTEGGSVAATLTGFAETDFTETQQARDSQFKVDGYPPGVDTWISRSSNTIDDVISGVTLHLHDTTDENGEEINMTRDVESIKGKITDFVEAYNNVVAYIKEMTGYNDVIQVPGVLMGDYVVTSIRERLRSPLYTRTNGFVEDVDTFLTPAHIGFELDQNGMLEFDTTAFDEAIGEDYLGVLAILGADKSGSSDSSDIKFYGASSNYTTAESYRVKVEYDASGNLSQAFFKLESESDSEYRPATIVDNYITGDSTFNDDGQPNNPENGLQVTASITGTAGSTVYATIRVKQGFAGAIEDTLDKVLAATNGSININQEHVDDQIKTLQDKIDSEETRLEKKEERLILRFAMLEKTLSLLQSQMSYLSAFGL